MADSILDRFDQNMSEDKKVDTGRKIRVGIIGTGWIAEAHATSYKKQPNVEIVALADLIPGKAEAFAKTYGIEGAKYYGEHTEMLADLENLKLDAVSVCTYNRQHAVCTIDCLKAGLPVLLEKPMCVTMDEAIAICKAEKESGKIVSVGFQPRFDVNIQMIKKIVDSGELGKIYYIQTGGGRRHGIPTPYGTTFIEDRTAGLGALADIGCYSLDLVLNAIGYPKPLTVTGYRSDFFGKMPETYEAKGQPGEYAKLFSVDDFGAGFIRLEGGIILDFRMAWYMHLDTPGDTIIMGTKGSLRIPTSGGGVDSAMKIYHDVCGKPTETIVPFLQNKPGESIFDLKIKSFLEAAMNGGPSPVPTSQIIYNQAIISGIAESSAKGEEIKIEIPEI